MKQAVKMRRFEKQSRKTQKLWDKRDKEEKEL